MRTTEKAAGEAKRAGKRMQEGGLEALIDSILLSRVLTNELKRDDKVNQVRLADTGGAPMLPFRPLP